MSHDDEGGPGRGPKRIWAEPSAEWIERPAWHAKANCGAHGPLGHMPAERRIDIMFPGKGQRIPREICEDCPVRAECAEAGRNERHGVWGGKSEHQRRSVRAVYAPNGEIVWPARRRNRLLEHITEWTPRAAATQWYTVDGKANHRSSIEAMQTYIRQGWIEMETLADGTQMVRAARRNQAVA